MPCELNSSECIDPAMQARPGFPQADHRTVLASDPTFKLPAAIKNARPGDRETEGEQITRLGAEYGAIILFRQDYLCLTSSRDTPIRNKTAIPPDHSGFIFGEMATDPAANFLLQS